MLRRDRCHRATVRSPDNRASVIASLQEDRNLNTANLWEDHFLDTARPQEDCYLDTARHKQDRYLDTTKTWDRNWDLVMPQEDQFIANPKENRSLDTAKH